jgi:hypothetical protein
MISEIDLINPVQTITAFKGLTNADLLPLGKRSEIPLILSKICPHVVFPTDPASPNSGKIASEDYYLEFYIPDNDPVLMLGLDVRSGQEEAVMRVIRSICQGTGWRACDPVEETFIQFDNGYREPA